MEQEDKPKSSQQNVRKIAIPILLLFIIIGTVVGVLYWLDSQKYIYSDKAVVSVPLIQLTPEEKGVFKEIYVQEGQKVQAHESVAKVGYDIISAEIPGIIATVKQDFGAIYNPGQAVVTMYDPAEMRIVASIPEDKGLKDIHEGQKVKFTVDVFGTEEFEGTVEEVKEISNSDDVVFSISDKREIKNFDIKIKYNQNNYPHFKDGMSAKVWIYKQ